MFGDYKEDDKVREIADDLINLVFFLYAAIGNLPVDLEVMEEEVLVLAGVD